MQASSLGLGSPGSFGDPTVFLATQAEAASQLAWGRGRGVFPGPEEPHTPHG